MIKIVWKGMLGIALLLLIGAIFISTVPLQFVLNKVDMPDTIEIQTLTGSVWSGQAHVFLKDKRYAAHDLNKFDLFWEWCPSATLLRACAKVANTKIKGEGNVSYSALTQALFFENIVVDANIQNYPYNYKGFPMSISGEGRLMFDDFSMVIARPYETNAKGVGGISSLMNNDVSLGKYDLSVVYEKQQLKTLVSGGTGDIKVKGQGEVDVTPKGQSKYRYFVDLNTGNAILLSILSTYGRLTRKNQITFSGSGYL